MALPSAGPTDCSSGLSNRIFNNLRYDNPWQAGATVAVGALACPTTPNGFGYKCTSITTGITAGGEPTWPVILTNTVVDGGVTWTCQDVANPTAKNHAPSTQFGYAYSSNDLDYFRLLAYDIAKAICDELAADNEAWQAVAGGVGFGANFSGASVQFKRGFDGEIEIRGTVATSANQVSGAAMFTLPANYRPPTTLNLCGLRNSAGGHAFYWLQVSSTGAVSSVDALVTGDTIELSMIRFDTRS